MKFSLLLGLSLVGIYFANRELLQMEREHQDNPRLVPPPVEHIDKLAFGYRDLLADALWIRTIQNFEECKIMGVETPEFSKSLSPPEQQAVAVADKADSQVMEVLKRSSVARRGRCSRGWPFQMMDGATRLAPRFAIIYQLGATALSVLLDDFEGASILFDRGVAVLPQEWTIAYRAAYHELFDMKNFDKAAALLQKAADNGAPLWAKSLAARLYTQSGQATLALPLLQAVYDRTDNEVAKADLKKRMEALKKMLHP